MPSTIPAALDALIGLLRASSDSVGLAPAKVVDGFPRFPITDTDFIAVGGKPEPTADGERGASDLQGRSREERFGLAVYCSSSRGGVDQKASRDRAFELLGFVEDVLAADRSLGGVVSSAEVLGGVSLFQTDASSAEDGSHAEVSAVVSVRAWL